MGGREAQASSGLIGGWLGWLEVAVARVGLVVAYKPLFEKRVKFYFFKSLVCGVLGVGDVGWLFG